MVLPILDECSTACTKCENGKASCKPNCYDQRKYFECQSMCIESGSKDPQKCIGSNECSQKCDKQCTKYWKGR